VRFLSLVLILASAGCSPALVVRRHLPPPIDLGSERHVFVEVQAGPRDSSLLHTVGSVKGLWTGEQDDPGAPVEALREQLPARLEGTGYFAVVSPENAELLLRLTVTQWSMRRWTLEGPDNAQRFVEARLSAQLRVIRREGQAPLAVRDYSADARWEATGDELLSEWAEPMMQQTLQTLLGQIVFELAPTIDERRIPLDDGPAEVKPAVALIQKGELLAARQLLEELLVKSPNSAEGHYNLGVLEEGDSNFPAAERLYRRAHELKSARRYVDALNRVKGLRRVTITADR
jgi:tetratricopeptide (TPR) repeat protein